MQEASASCRAEEIKGGGNVTSAQDCGGPTGGIAHQELQPQMRPSYHTHYFKQKTRGINALDSPFLLMTFVGQT